jgi:hypothetical protein
LIGTDAAARGAPFACADRGGSFMNTDPIRGQTVRLTFSDGPMAKKTFEHVFEAKGTVHFHAVGAQADGPKASDPKYESVTLSDDVVAVSYLGSGGYTLTTVLDFKTKKLVAFSSNEKGVSVQHGTFEVVERSSAQAPSSQGHN